MRQAHEAYAESAWSWLERRIGRAMGIGEHAGERSTDLCVTVSCCREAELSVARAVRLSANPMRNARGIRRMPKDLALVEWAFRTSETVELEMRPIHVRLTGRTRGHALVVMLAYRIV